MIRLGVLGSYQSPVEEQLMLSVESELQGILQIEKISDKNYDGDFIMALGDECLSLEGFSVLSHSVRQYGYWNFAERVGKNWIPISTVGPTLKSLIVQYQPHLDNSLPAFIVGSSHLVTDVIEGLARFGFKTFYVMAKNKSSVEEIKMEVQKSIFGLQIHVIEPKNLITYSGTGSALINTEKLSEEDDVYFNISYFNYLKKESFVLSFSPQIPEAFYKEAGEVGLSAIGYPAFFANSFLQSPLAAKIRKNQPDLDLASKIKKSI